jgi:PhnB protein
MSIRKITPYLMFNGTADKAIKLYERALGTRTEALQRFGDVPGDSPAPEHKDRIMHALLRLGEAEIMISDSRPDDQVPTRGNVHIALDFTDAAEMTQRFDALASGGTVTMPVADTFWGAKFGMLTDAFGIAWMFNCDTKKG